MAAEVRKGKLYVYRKRREGERVISEYVGGSVVDLMAYQVEKEQREREREKVHACRANVSAIDAELDRASAMVDSVVSQTLASAGYHYHRGEWRKKKCRQ